MTRLVQPARLHNVRQAAKYLLACEIVRTLDSGEVLRAKIVETESYHQDDPASHTFGGQSARNQAMFGEAGHAYIYFTYGIHWCFNVTAGQKGYGAGVLIRAAEPIDGIETMKNLRDTLDLKNLTNGPAKLAQAFQINKTLYGHNLRLPPLQIYEARQRNFEIIETTRIGISIATTEIARFYIKDSSFISKK